MLDSPPAAAGALCCTWRFHRTHPDAAGMETMHVRHPRDSRSIRRRGIEKEILRLAFDDPLAPWLPDDVLWRQKEQFSDGVGYAWVDTVRAVAAARTFEADLLAAPARFPEDPPVNPEMLWMRQMFEAEFVHGRVSGRSALATIGTGRSIACSSPEAVAWDPAWVHLAGDISGRAIANVHAAGCALTR